MGFNWPPRLLQLILLFLLIAISLKSFAQEENTKKQVLEDLIENIASSTDAELDYTTIFEDLNYYLNNPLNLNTATIEELEKLQILSDFQIKSLHDYIKQNGEMLSIYELQLVFGFIQQDIDLLIPFVTISKSEQKQTFNIKNALKYSNNQLFIRAQQIIEQQQGYAPISDSLLALNSNSRYLGNPTKLYTRYKYNYKDLLSFGITAEKDAGEEFFKGSNAHGFDFYSGHLVINKLGVFQTVVLGDFQAKFGQGLVMLSELSSGKSSYVLNTRKRAQGLSKYSSANENEFMRGVGTTIRLKSFDITAFASYKNIDANTSDSLNEELPTFTAFQNTGLHAIPSEIKDEKSINEQIIGGNVTFNHSKFKIGITGLNYTYNADLVRTVNPENQFDFKGNQNTNLSLDYYFGLNDFSFFGEEAISHNGGLAFLNGMYVNLVPQVSLSVLHRYYEKDYQANYSNAFGESSGTNNESGLYFGIEVYPIKQWKISAYYDTYKFPWLTNSTDAPSEGNDYSLQADFNASRDVNMYFRFKYEEKQINQTQASGLDEITTQENLKIRFHLSYNLSRQLSLKSRIETSRYQKEDAKSEYGYMIYQDIFYSLNCIPLNLNLRFAVFDTDTYNSRIYAYESDMLYNYSVPAYYSKGTRFYLNLKYTITEFLDLWIRYSQTYYSDLDVISSGLAQINGNTKSEIKAQIRIRF
ncbi:MAG: ComEA family DNA-binding protein [Bacteroidales bacterium]